MRLNPCIRRAETVVLPAFGDKTITVTNRMLLKNGTPVLPVMGELHYSRVPAECWKEELQKMKDGGVDIVASYVFWIHHEESKGCFDFSGNRNLRRFIELCHEVGLDFCLRIGPWAHGECRNGGFPDWLLEECPDTLRSSDEPYISYVRRFLCAVAEQVRGLPLIGIQVENEMTYRPEYLEEIRKIVLETGLHAPLLTATGWGQARLPETLLPMFGGYPEAPWEGHTRPLAPNNNYLFSYQREDSQIGSDLLKAGLPSADKYEGHFPYLTCEVGGGNQVTYHRRPFFTARDIEALVLCKIGSGVNLLGYYMYHGGINPVGKTTMQESRETGYPNDCPIFSYDFQSPLGEAGQMRESYVRLARLHQFLHAFGSLLAPMDTVLPDVLPKDAGDQNTLRCALRADENGGFLFVNNHIRLTTLPEHKNVPMEVEFRHRTVCFSMDIPSDACFVLPVSLTLASLPVTYATAQPVSVEEHRLTLEKIPGVTPVLALDDGRTFPLADGITIIDGTEVCLVSPEPYLPTPLTPLSATPAPDTISAQSLLGHLGLADRSTDYLVTWDEGTTYLVIRAQGNVAGFYLPTNGGWQLISDQYLYGDTWVMDVRRIPVREGRLKIQPFAPEDEGSVYLEIPFCAGTAVPEIYSTHEQFLRV